MSEFTVTMTQLVYMILAIFVNFPSNYILGKSLTTGVSGLSGRQVDTLIMRTINRLIDLDRFVVDCRRCLGENSHRLELLLGDTRLVHRCHRVTIHHQRSFKDRCGLVQAELSNGGGGEEQEECRVHY